MRKQKKRNRPAGRAGFKFSDAEPEEAYEPGTTRFPLLAMP